MSALRISAASGERRDARETASARDIFRRRFIDECLAGLHGEIVREPVPPRFEALLRKLAERQGPA